MSEYQLSAKPRKLFGRKVKSLRREGIIPGNVFGKNTKSISIQINHPSLLKIIRSAGETSLISLKIEGENKPRPVLIAGYAQDPVTDAILHVDLHQVDLTAKTTATVPVKISGEAPAVVAGNVLVTLKNELEVEALPTDLPEAIEIDISSLKEVGDSLLAKDLRLDRAKVSLQIGDEEPIVTIQEPAKEEAPAPAEETEGETQEEEVREEEAEKKGEAKKDETETGKEKGGGKPAADKEKEGEKSSPAAKTGKS